MFMAYEQGDVYGVPYLLWRGLVQLPRFWGLYKPWWRTIHFHLAVCCFTLRWGYFAHLMTSPVRRDNFGLLWRNGLYRTTSAVTNDLSYFFTQSSISMSRLFQQARDLKTYYNQDTHNKTEDNSLWAKNPQSRRKTTNRYDLCWGEICHHRFGKKKFLNFLFTDDKIYSFHRQFS